MLPRLVPVLALAAVIVFQARSFEPVAGSGSWYVAPSGSNSADCLTPSTACATISGAVAKAGAEDTVRVAVGTYVGAGSEVVLLTKNVVLSGGWDATYTIQNGTSTIDGQVQRRGITVSGTISVTVDHFTVQNGFDTSVVGGGGGISSDTGNLTVSNSTIRNNQSLYPTGGARGGGIFSRLGTLNVINSTISDNTADFNGGGIDSGPGPAYITNSTISGNRVGKVGYSGGGGGGGIIAFNNTLVMNNSTVVSNTVNVGASFYGGGVLSQGQTTMRNTIVAGNSNVAQRGVDCYGIVVSAGFNLIENPINCNFSPTTGDLPDVAPKLGPLQDNGGPTMTHAELADSPTLDAGNPMGCQDQTGQVAADERGLPRFGRCDTGAFEAQRTNPSAKSVDRVQAYPGDRVNYTMSLANAGPGNLGSVVVTDTLPSSLEYVPNSVMASAGNVVIDGGVIKWSGQLDVGSPVTVTLGAKISSSAPVGQSVDNSAQIDAAGVVLTRLARTRIVVPPLYLPFVVK